jgi:hypothetical protein
VVHPEIPGLGRLRQEDLEFQATLGYTVRSCLKKKKKKEHLKKKRMFITALFVIVKI